MQEKAPRSTSRNALGLFKNFGVGFYFLFFTIYISRCPKFLYAHPVDYLRRCDRNSHRKAQSGMVTSHMLTTAYL